MADKHQSEEEPGQTNVVILSRYRKSKVSSEQHEEEDFQIQAHLYVDLCSDGEMRFGVTGADEENAICLLEPIFVLSQQLVRLATD